MAAVQKRDYYEVLEVERDADADAIKRAFHALARDWHPDVSDSPDRYKIVSLLMLYDMQTWKDKDLGWIARKMDNIERRLELARGGPQTQKMQTEVVRRLDEIIKEMENQKKGS